jgi:translation initiation factor 1A
MRKKVWVSAGDIVLVSMREFQDGKGDVILKYTADEARSLKTLGQLPESVVINDTADGDDVDGGIEFAEDDDDDDDEVNVDDI